MDVDRFSAPAVIDRTEEIKGAGDMGYRECTQSARSGPRNLMLLHRLNIHLSGRISKSANAHQPLHFSISFRQKQFSGRLPMLGKGKWIATGK